jgi:hypothetical protein
LYEPVAAWLEAKCRLRFLEETPCPEINVLVHGDRMIASRLGCDERPSAAIFVERNELLFVSGLHPCLIRYDPNLQEVHRLSL